MIAKTGSEVLRVGTVLLFLKIAIGTTSPSKLVKFVKSSVIMLALRASIF
jgi:hypothetical protein